MIDTTCPPAAVTPDRLRAALAHFPTGVVVITAGPSAVPVGMAVNSFTSLSLEPPMVLFCAARSSTTWPAIRAHGAFTANILSRNQEALARRFAARDVDRFAGVAGSPTTWDTTRIAGACAWVDCRIGAEYEAGDHVIVVGVVLAIEEAGEADALVFHRGRFR